MILNELVLFFASEDLDYSPDKIAQQLHSINFWMKQDCLPQIKKKRKLPETFLSSFSGNGTINMFLFGCSFFKFNFLFASVGKEVNPHLFDVKRPRIK